MHAVTDETGVFSAELIPGELYKVNYFPPKGLLTRYQKFDGYDAVSAPAAFAKNELPTVELMRVRTIEGTVLTAEGKPFAGAQVLADWQDPDERGGFHAMHSLQSRKAVRTDENGRFKLDEIHPLLDVELRPTLHQVVLGEAISVHSEEVDPVTLKTDRFEFYYLFGRFVDEAGSPVAGAPFQIMLEKGEHTYQAFQGVTDINGRFKTPREFVSDRSYHLQVRRNGDWQDVQRSSTIIPKKTDGEFPDFVVDPTQLRLHDIFPEPVDQ